MSGCERGRSQRDAVSTYQLHCTILLHHHSHQIFCAKMDGPAVAASVGGLVKITANVICFLVDAQDAPTVARDLLSEVQAIQLTFE